MKTLTLIWVLMCLGCTQLQGTTVVVVRTVKHFVVAADSLWLSSDNDSMFLCKIRRFRHIYFVASTNDVDALQFITLAGQAMKTSTTIAEAAHGLALKSDEIAKRTAEMAPQSAIDGCWGRRCAQAMFFGIESGVPTWVVVNFEQIGNSRKNLQFIPHEIPCLGRCLDRPQTVIIIGQDEAINRSKTDPTFIKGLSDQAAARKLVELEEKADPEEVGGPIDLLTLDGAGAHWAYVKGGTCSPEETQPKVRKPKKPKAQRAKP